MKKLFLTIALLVAFGMLINPRYVVAADTAGAGVYQRTYENSNDSTIMVEVVWEATDLGGVTPYQVSGLTTYYLWKMLTDPSGVTNPTNKSGVSRPTDNYDIYLIDVEHGNDVLGGVGLNRDDTDSEVEIIRLNTNNDLYGGYYMFPDSGVSLHVRNNSISGASGTVTFFGYK